MMASSSSSSAAPKMVVLKCSDGTEFEIEEAVALQSRTIKHMIELDDRTSAKIPLPNVTAPILKMIIHYLKRHLASDATADELNSFDQEFVKVDQPTIFHLVEAANYLDIRSLLDLTSHAAANMLKEKTPEEIRKMFNIKNDFTPEEEEAIRQFNARGDMFL